MGNLEGSLGEPLSLSGRVRRELQFDLESMARENTLSLADKNGQVLDTREDIHSQLGRLLGHRGEGSEENEQHRQHKSSYRHPTLPRDRHLKSVLMVLTGTAQDAMISIDLESVEGGAFSAGCVPDHRAITIADGSDKND
jgi:hypothetical protein